MKIVAWDLDSTIASTVHRRHLIPEVQTDSPAWHAYSKACAEDEPIEGTIALMRLLRLFVRQHIVTGRSELARPDTRDWLSRHDVPCDLLVMRAVADDRVPGEELKIRYIRRVRAAGNEVVLFVDDWEPAAVAIRRATGVPVLVVNPCDPPELQLAAIRQRLDGQTGLVSP
jgi:hypothetical protein